MTQDQIATLNRDFGSEWSSHIDRVAKSFARSYPEVELDDLAQQLYEWALQHWSAIVEYERLGETGMLVRAMQNQATMICRVERLRYQQATGQILYGTFETRDLLERTFAAHGWLPDVGEFPEVRVDADTALTGDGVAALADVSRGLDLLSDDRRRVLTARYGHPTATWGDCAVSVGMTEAGFRKSCQRAVNALTGVMNGAARDRAVSRRRVA